jgi:hypothetical protein
LLVVVVEGKPLEHQGLVLLALEVILLLVLLC